MEGDAGASQLNPTGPREQEVPPADGPSEEVVTEAPAEETVTEEPGEPAPETPVASPSQPSRLSRGWLMGICAALLVLGAGVAAGGYFALRAHSDSEATARDEAAAVKAAQDCVTATQAPDTAAMAGAQQKIIECSTGDFRVQATMYSSMLVDAYQAANVKVEVTNMRSAVERHNDDGSMNVLVAVRVKVSNSEAQQQEQGYRLRVKMAQDEGQYRIARLDQVSS